MEGSEEEVERLAADAEAIFLSGLRAVQADRMLRELDWPAFAPRDFDEYAGVDVLGMGKASMALAGEIEDQLGDRLRTGVVVVPEGHPASFPDDLTPPMRIELLEAAHPVPDDRSAAAGRRLLREARASPPDHLLLVLISGGGSSLAAVFQEGISIEDARETFGMLLESGADIHAMNTVRKHISAIGGGRLAAAADGTDMLALVVSDVVGDDLSVIASGPTVPDPTTARDAVSVLRRHDLWRSVPESVRRHLSRAATDASLWSPDEQAPFFARVETKLVGTNRQALEACAIEARRRGYDVETRSGHVTGEARAVGRRLARELTETEHGRCLLWGGETTVTVAGEGRGGRNQELALSAALELHGVTEPIALLSAGTDGIDGPTPAAGAVATTRSVQSARSRGVDPESHLERNDAYTFWRQTGGLIETGPTHTNVMDLQVGLTAPS